jgi:ankyrin repeat protein
MLLSANASPIQFNVEGYGAHSLAYFNNFFDLSRLIADVGLERAILLKDFRVMFLLMQDGANVNFQTESGTTALMAAAIANENFLFSQMLAFPGINVNFQDEDGWTALMFATYNNNVEIVTDLLDHGVNLYLESVQGYTAFSIARDFSCREVHDALEQRVLLMANLAAAAAAAQETKTATLAANDNTGSAEKSHDGAANAKSGWKLW